MCTLCGHCMASCPHQALSVGGVAPESLTQVHKDLAVNTDQAVQFLASRRSVRAYKKAPLEQELIEQVLNVTRWSPTGLNRQPVQWLVYNGRDRVSRLAGITADFLRGNEFFSGLAQAWDAGQDRILRGAPAVVIAHAPAENNIYSVDCVSAMTYLDLAAKAHGLGACWAGLLMMAAGGFPAMQAELNLPQGNAVFAAMMLGRPKFAYHAIPQRKPLAVEWR